MVVENGEVLAAFFMLCTVISWVQSVCQEVVLCSSCNSSLTKGEDHHLLANSILVTLVHTLEEHRMSSTYASFSVPSWEWTLDLGKMMEERLCSPGAVAPPGGSYLRSPRRVSHSWSQVLAGWSCRHHYPLIFLMVRYTKSIMGYVMLFVIVIHLLAVYRSPSVITLFTPC